MDDESVPNTYPGPIHRCVGLRGNIRHDSFGRIIIDSCPSDSHHLRFSETDPETNRPQCRVLLEEFFDMVVGKHGTLELEFAFLEHSPEEGK